MFLPIHNGGMTKAIQIFRSGTHIDSHGQKITISNDDIDKMISEYNEGNHKAPLTIGHPKDNHPAFGWIEKLKRKGNLLYASFCDVHDDVKQAVSDKLYQKVSASFYAPQHPHNYSEGWGIRHVGLLGATAPAVKGLENVAFNEKDDADCLTVEFAEVHDWSVKNIIAKFTDFIHAEFSEANPVDIKQQRGVKGGHREAVGSDLTAEAHVAPPLNINDEKEQSMTEQEKAKLDAREAELKKQQDALNKQTADFTENMRATTLETTKANLAGLRDAGKISPIAYDKAVDFAESLSNTVTVDFSEANNMGGNRLAAMQSPHAPNITNPVADFGKFITEFSEAIQAGTAPKGEASASDGTVDFSEGEKTTAIIDKTQSLMASNPNLTSAQAAVQATKELS